MTIYWIDDETLYLELIQMTNHLSEKPLKIITLSHCKFLKNYELKKGDIVIHDKLGVGDLGQKADGVKYFSHSGHDNCDIPKPCELDSIFKMILDTKE